MLKVMCGYHNHDMSHTLVGHPFAGRLKSSEQSLLLDMSKSQVKPANILLTLKENSECNVTMIKLKLFKIVNNQNFNYSKL